MTFLIGPKSQQRGALLFVIDLVRRIGSLIATGAPLLRLERAVDATRRFAYFRLEPLEAAVKISSGSPMSLPGASLDPASFDWLSMMVVVFIMGCGR